MIVLAHTPRRLSVAGLGGLCALSTLAVLALAPRRCAAQPVAPPSAGNGWNALVARVGEKMITEHDVATRQRALLLTIQRTPGLTPRQKQQGMKQVRENVLYIVALLAQEELMLLEADRREKELNQMLNEARIEMILEREIDAIGGGSGLARARLTRGQLREHIHRREKINWLMSLRRHLAPRASPADVKAYYKEHFLEFEVEEGFNIRMILLRKTGPPQDGKPTTAPGDRKRAAAIRQAAALPGADFVKLVEKHSDSLVRAKGRLSGREYEPATVLPSPILDVLRALSPPAITPVIDYSSALAIVKYESHRAKGRLLLEEVHDRIERRLNRDLLAEARKVFVRELFRKARITDENGKRIPSERLLRLIE